MLVVIVGWLMLASSLASQVVGLPQQIIKNFRRKSVEGLSILFFTAGVSSYVTATWWALLERQWLLAASRMPGALFTSVIVLQATYFWFRRRSGGLESGSRLELITDEWVAKIYGEFFEDKRFWLRTKEDPIWREVTLGDYRSARIRCGMGFDLERLGRTMGLFADGILGIEGVIMPSRVTLATECHRSVLELSLTA